VLLLLLLTGETAACSCWLLTCRLLLLQLQLELHLVASWREVLQEAQPRAACWLPVVVAVALGALLPPLLCCRRQLLLGRPAAAAPWLLLELRSRLLLLLLPRRPAWLVPWLLLVLLLASCQGLLLLLLSAWPATAPRLHWRSLTPRCRYCCRQLQLLLQPCPSAAAAVVLKRAGRLRLLLQQVHSSSTASWQVHL
jgi:hypothetical protein